jgi:hypothetical protein
MRHSASPSTTHASPTPARRRFSRTAFVTLALAFIAIIAATSVVEIGTRNGGGAINPICEPWDSAASSAVARLVADTSDAAARQLADSVFRLRRARKNCRIGWVNLACQDYRALIGEAAAPGHATECFSAVVAGAQAEARR